MGKWIHKITEYDEANMTGICQNCGPVKLKKKQDRYLCKVSQNRWQGKRYGLTQSEYDALWVNASCAICSQTTNLCVDHDHATGQVRGILCGNCNFGIGHFKDDVGLLQKAISYLE